MALDFGLKVPKTFQVVASSLRSGAVRPALQGYLSCERGTVVLNSLYRGIFLVSEVPLY
jgi:hypothetical protein